MPTPVKMRSTHHSVGFYLPHGPRLDREFYDQILSWFEAKACSVDTIGLGSCFKGIRQFSRMHKKIEQFELDKAASLEINSHAEGAKNQLEDCKLCVSLSDHAQTFALSSRTDIYPRGQETLELLIPVIERLQPEYGIGFTRNFYYGPICYVWGLLCNHWISEEDLENCSGWTTYGMKRFIWRQGQIRDLYPWNFLNHSQLNAKVANKTLRQWIESKSGRGILQPVGENLTLWDVPEEQIRAIRPVLWDAGVIFDYHQIVEEELKNAPLLPEDQVMQLMLGGRKPEEVRVLKSLGAGKTRELSTEEVKRLAGKKSQKK